MEIALIGPGAAPLCRAARALANHKLDKDCPQKLCRARRRREAGSRPATADDAAQRDLCGQDCSSYCLTVPNIEVSCLADASAAEGRHWDLLALTQSAVRQPLRRALQADNVLLPGGAVLPDIQTHQAVAYGFSPRDTLTLSSLNGAESMLCLQRSMINLRGEPLEPQELRLPPVSRALDAWQALFLAGLLIFCLPAGSELRFPSAFRTAPSPLTSDR